jgi:hypothetical protein
MACASVREAGSASILQLQITASIQQHLMQNAAGTADWQLSQPRSQFIHIVSIRLLTTAGLQALQHSRHQQSASTQSTAIHCEWLHRATTQNKLNILLSK